MTPSSPQTSAAEASSTLEVETDPVMASAMASVISWNFMMLYCKLGDILIARAKDVGESRDKTDKWQEQEEYSCLIEELVTSFELSIKQRRGDALYRATPLYN